MSQEERLIKVLKSYGNNIFRTWTIKFCFTDDNEIMQNHCITINSESEITHVAYYLKMKHKHFSISSVDEVISVGNDHHLKVLYRITYYDWGRGLMNELERI